MSIKKIGHLLAAVGIIGVIISILVDYIGLGDDGIQAAQLLGIQIGIILAVIGFSMIFGYSNQRVDIRNTINTFLERTLNLPVIVWTLVGFLITYIAFFVFPAFLNPKVSMQYFYRYLPDKYPIGLDLQTTMGLVKSWVVTRQSPYPNEFYPPLTYIFFAPLTLINYPISYKLTTFLTIFCYGILAAVIPLKLASKKDYSIISLLFFSGLLSYGFQFELERGQFNVMAFLLCMIAIYIFYKHYELRYLAYLLFSISIHLKVYPAIFILLFIKDWKDWKNNLKRVFGLGLFNLLLLFVLGYRNFIGFTNALIVQLHTPGWSWNGNHSVNAFVFNFLKDGYNLLPETTLSVLQQNSRLLELILLLIIFICIVYIAVKSYQTKPNEINPYLLLACTLGALIIPTSNDYTLPILVAPMAIFLQNAPIISNSKQKFLSILFVLIISIAYSSILYPFKYKPYFLNNSFPPLFMILISVTLLYSLTVRNRVQQQEIQLEN